MELFRKMNYEVMECFRQNILQFSDTTLTGLLQMPLLYYKSLIFNSWKNETEQKIYCSAALHNLQILLLLLGKPGELLRIYQKFGPEVIGYSFTEIPDGKKQKIRFRLNRVKTT